MLPAYTLSVEKTGPSSSYLDSVFLKFLVTKTQAPFHKRVFVYCLHCLRLASPSWFDSHKRQVSFDLSPEAIERHRNRLTQYVEDVTTEVEFLFDSGKLFRESKATPKQRQGQRHPVRIQDFPVVPEMRRSEQIFSTDSDSDDDEDYGDEEDEEDTFKSTIECI